MNFVNGIIARLKSGLSLLSPTCREASRWQSEALDHRLPPLRRAGLWLHVLICQWCRRYGRQVRFLRQAAHEHPEEFTEAADQKLSGAARERIKEKLRGEKK